MNIDEEEYLSHYGILRRSGRYEWGSSNNVTKRSMDFLDYVAEMKSKGLSDVEIANGVGWTTNDLRNAKTIANAQKKQAEISRAWALKEKGLSQTAISIKMYGTPTKESNVRALLAPGAADKVNVLATTASMLRDQIKEKRFLDVGKGVEHYLNISYDKLKAAVAMLKEEGYLIHKYKQLQQGTGKFTEMKILGAPGSTQREIFLDPSKIGFITEVSDDGGRTWFGIKPPLSIDPKRVAVNYSEDGGGDADGVIFVREGVKDVSLGKSRYAQVRIQVGDGHYLKGMAMYKKDLPKGVDLVFNTNKSKDSVASDLDAMKELAKDPSDPSKVNQDNPFGAVIKAGGQQFDEDGNVSSVMNIVNEEGDWQDWSRTLSSQMLSKQEPRLAKTQLNKTFDIKESEFKEIMALTNPSIKRKLLESFADDVDASAVHLKAAALNQRQQYQVILPINSLKDNEIYAPNYKNGETVVLIRHPHGGTFEIPRLVVNNNNPEGKSLLKQTRDAVGINSAVAERLSGADFDGDAVVVIPDPGGVIKDTPALEALKGFDAKAMYPGYEGMPKINTQQEMGAISNLITDMTVQAAPPSDIARAVKHSMVVIDAEKHNLNYKQSALDNGIKQLKERYQGGPRAGAATLLSRATASVFVPRTREARVSEGGPINPVTGEKQTVPTGETYKNRKGEVVIKKQESQRLAETTDAFSLIDGTGTPIERIYAEHSNKLKDLANRTRLAMLDTKPIPKNPTARRAYQAEVDRLTAGLKLAERNKPLERQAQVIAGVQIRARLQDNPGIDDDAKRKIKFQALTEARNRTRAGKDLIDISDSEWDAIQAGAISPSMLDSILDNADLDRVKQLATPRVQRTVTPAKLSRARAMMAGGATRAEVAAALGIALGTLDEALYGRRE